MIQDDHQRPTHFGFLLFPKFSFVSLAVVIEPMRMANTQAGRKLFTWELLTPDDQPIQSASDLPIQPTMNCSDANQLDILIVVSNLDVHKVDNADLFQWLRQLQRRQITLGSISTGALILARAKVIQNRVCTIHWENIDGLREEFPSLNVSGQLYEFDRGLMTCSGGVSGLDMMLHYIGLHHGESLAKKVAEVCIHPNIRPAHEDNRMALQTKFNVHHPRLVRAIELMNEYLENPVTMPDIAKQAGLSIRQMERLFKDKLQQRPAGFYMRLRLERARLLLQQSTMSVLDIATACGFNSAAYFAKCFRQQYDYSPRDERSAKRYK